MANRLSDKVYYTEHNHATDRPAVGIIIGEKAVMLIDGGNSPAHATEIISAVRELTDLPIKYIGVTHWHWDHTFGLSAYGDVTVIAHPDCNRELERMKAYKWDDESIDKRVKNGEEIDFCAENIKKEYTDRNEIKIRTADILTEGGLTVDLGGVTVSCFYIGGEHSADSLGYFVNGENVLFLGDSLCHNMFTGAWSYDLEDFKHCLSAFEELPAEWFVNSHWAPQNKEEFKGFADNMIFLGNVVGDIKNVNEAVEKYTAKTGNAPDEETRDLLRSYVDGNLKK